MADIFKAHIKENNIQSCEEHSRNVAEKASRTLNGIGLSSSGYLSGLCHDVGKYTDEFQEYLHKAVNGEVVVKGSVIHSFAGVKLLLENFDPRYSSYPENNGCERVAAEMIATSIASHHGLIDELDVNGNSSLLYRCEKQPAYDKRAINAFLKEEGGTDALSEMFGNATEEIKSIYSKCMSLASQNDENKNECLFFYLGLIQRLLTSAIIDADRTDTAEFMQEVSYDSYINEGNPEIWRDALSNLEQLINKFPCDTEIQKARREMSDICAEAATNAGGIYRLNMPTGGGKTLSSLRYALKHAGLYGKSRIVFAIPLLSVLDQNVDIIREAVGDSDIVLEHHSDVIRNDLNSEELTKYDMLTDTWNSPIIVTTFVQLLNAIFSGRSSAVRRFHSLCNSVIIIDEVQNVPEKMISLFTMAINFLSRICGATVVLCSATQPRFEIDTFRLLTDGDLIEPLQLEKYNDIFKRTETSYIGEMNHKEIAEHARHLCDEQGNLLIVCNTKKGAKDIYNELISIDCSCVYLSTSLCMAHRKDTLRRLRKMLDTGEKVICVSTQLIEAGVDISFASAIRLTAGIDNVAQAAGRCNRHGEKEGLAPVEIISLKGEKLAFLKEIENAKALTEGLIIEFQKDPEGYHNDLLSNKAIEYFYTHKATDLNEHIGKTMFVLPDGRTIFDLLSMNRHNPATESWAMRQAFKTAGNSFEVFDDNSRTLIVPYNSEACSIINGIFDADAHGYWDKLKSLIARTKAFTVQVFEYQYDQLLKAGAIIEAGEGTIAILQPGYYDTMLGVINPQDADVNKVDEAYIV